MNKAQHEKEDHEKFVTVFEAGNEAMVAVVKSILDEANIRYVAEGEGVQVLFASNPLTGPVIFQVMPDDVEYARELLKDVKPD